MTDRPKWNRVGSIMEMKDGLFVAMYGRDPLRPDRIGCRCIVYDSDMIHGKNILTDFPTEDTAKTYCEFIHAKWKETGDLELPTDPKSAWRMSQSERDSLGSYFPGSITGRTIESRRSAAHADAKGSILVSGNMKRGQ